MKRIIVDLTSPKHSDTEHEVTEKKTSARKITQMNTWNYDEITRNDELRILKQANTGEHENNDVKFMNRLLAAKVGAYRAQDRKKNLFEPSLFVTRSQVISKLLSSEKQCYYCNNDVKIFYSESRDPMQWTLERENNNFGHNDNNVVIACLKCNLERRTMYQGRYQYSTEFKKVVKLG